MSTIKITTKANIAANKSKVWEYYTQPDHIKNWNFASDTWHCPAASNDLRVGGKYRVEMAAKDGSFGFEIESVYTEITLGEKISYQMSDGREVNVILHEMGSTTEILVIFDAESENPIELQEAGWQAILNNFKKYTEEH